MARSVRKRKKSRAMAPPSVLRLLENLDHRVSRIEQILPTLAAKDDLKAFPTREDPKGFATKDDLKAFATRDDLRAFATKDDLKEEGEQSRRYMMVLHEDLVGRLNQHLDAYAHHDERLATHEHRLDAHETRLGTLDLRVRALAKPKQ